MNLNGKIFDVEQFPNILTSDSITTLDIYNRKGSKIQTLFQQSPSVSKEFKPQKFYPDMNIIFIAIITNTVPRPWSIDRDIFRNIIN